MKTPMQELIEELKEQAQFIKDDDCAQDKFFRAGLRNAIKYAEWLLEKEKEVMCEFADEFAIECINFHHEKTMSQEQFFNLTFNTKEK